MTDRKRHWVKLVAEEEWFENERRRYIPYVPAVFHESEFWGNCNARIWKKLTWGR